MPRFYKLSLVTISVSFCILAFVLGGELVCRLADSTVLSPIDLHADFGWTLRRSQHLQRLRNGKVAEFITNSEGFRDAEAPSPITPNTFLFLGDSYLAGRRVGESDLLTTILKAQGLNVLNRGVSAWSTDQQLIFLKKFADLPSIKRVVLLFSPNDLRENFSKNFTDVINGSIRFRPPVEISRLDKLLWWLAGESHLFQFLRHQMGHNAGEFSAVMGRYFVSKGLSTDEHEFYQRELTPLASAALKKTEILLRDMKMISQNKLTIVLIPTKYPLFFKQAHPNAVEEWLRKFCMQQDIPFHSLQHLTSEANAEQFFFDDLHFTAQGHQEVARALQVLLL